MDTHKPTNEPRGSIATTGNVRPSDAELPELDNPNVNNPDSEPGADTPRQRPITDNKAGG